MRLGIGIAVGADIPAGQKSIQFRRLAQATSTSFPVKRSTEQPFAIRTRARAILMCIWLTVPRWEDWTLEPKPIKSFQAGRTLAAPQRLHSSVGRGADS